MGCPCPYLGFWVHKNGVVRQVVVILKYELGIDNVLIMDIR